MEDLREIGGIVRGLGEVSTDETGAALKELGGAMEALGQKGVTLSHLVQIGEKRGLAEQVIDLIDRPIEFPANHGQGPTTIFAPTD